MASDWFIRPDALSRARKAQLLTQTELADKSGVSVRSIRAYERVEQRARLETIQCLAKTLSIEVKDIAILRPRDGNKPWTPKSASPPPPPEAPSPSAPRTPDLVSAIPPRTQLEVLVDYELANKIRPTLVHTPFGPAETITAKRLQDVFTAFRLHEGTRFAIDAHIGGMRGIAPPEAKLLSSRGGVAARFHLLKYIALDKTVGITVHSATSAHTQVLQALYGGTAQVFVRVVAVEGEWDDKRQGFSSFITKITPTRPWTFLVEGIVDGEPAPEKRRVSKKAGAPLKKGALKKKSAPTKVAAKKPAAPKKKPAAKKKLAPKKLAPKKLAPKKLAPKKKTASRKVVRKK